MSAVLAAQNLVKMGLEPTLITTLAAVPVEVDYDIACHITAHMAQNGVKLVKNAGGGHLSGGLGCVQYVTADGKTFAADMGVICALDAPKTTQNILQTHQSPHEKRELNLNILAKDVVTGEEKFAPRAATKIGRFMADCVFTGEENVEKSGSAFMRTAEIFGKTVATFGFSEKLLNERKMDYMFSVVPISGGFCKLVYDNGSKILGFAAFGQDAREYAGMLSVIVQMKGGIRDLVALETGENYVPLQALGKIAQNVLEKRIFMAYWDEICNYDPGKTMILDVRPGEAYLARHIEGAVNVPLADLRGSLYRLDGAKGIIVVCDTGKDSYLAARILMGHGFRVRQMTGGLGYYWGICDG
jgi:rhodanese-related sulfurtransferase